MRKSKMIYLFNIIVFVFVFFYVKNYEYHSIYSDETTITGVVTKISKKEDNIKIIVDVKEKVLVSCYKCEFNYNVGDIIEFNGSFQDIKVNSNFNLFNYKKYLKSLKIYKNFVFKSYKYIGSSNSILYKAYNSLNKKIGSLKSGYFLKAMVLGDTILLDNYENYKINGIVHLFAISGLHVGILSYLLTLILKKFSKLGNFAYLIIFPILIFYMLLINSASIIRSVCMYICTSLKKFLKISGVNILYYLAAIILIINPYSIYNMGFLLSYIITFFILVGGKKIEKTKNYFVKLFLISIISFLASLPVIVNSNFEINILTPIINLIIVPFVSGVIFPISILALIFPFFDNVLLFLLNGFDSLNVFLANIKLIINIGYLNMYIIIPYYIVLLAYILNSKFTYLLVAYFVFICLLKYININSYIYMMDIGQGDAILIKNYFNENILLDAGSTESSSKNVIIPFLKSLGITKIDRFIISHGDKDHIVGGVDVINSFDVRNVYLNSYKDTFYEKEISNLVTVNRISRNTCLSEHICIYNYPNKDENDDSLITYLVDYKALFMGDASSLVEEKIDLTDINILKVGHHGSKTGTSKEFIDRLKPKISIISVGKNNRYGHPNKEVLDVLNNSEIYRTDIDGSIMVNITNNKLKIETYTP